MRIVVAFKWARDPQDARVGADGRLDWRGAQPAVSDDDPVAALVARAAAGADDEIVGLTLGGGDTAWAAARGAARTLVITDLDPAADAATKAQALAAAVRRVGDVGLVVVGDCAWEIAVPGALAGALGWPALAGVENASTEGGALRVHRRSGGCDEEVAVTGPVVLAALARRAEQEKPGMKDVLTARKKPVETVTVAELDVATAPAVQVRGHRPPESVSSRVFDGSTPAQAAAQLVGALRADGVL